MDLSSLLVNNLKFSCPIWRPQLQTLAELQGWGQLNSGAGRVSFTPISLEDLILYLFLSVVGKAEYSRVVELPVLHLSSTVPPFITNCEAAWSYKPFGAIKAHNDSWEPGTSVQYVAWESNMFLSREGNSWWSRHLIHMIIFTTLLYRHGRHQGLDLFDFLPKIRQ